MRILLVDDEPDILRICRVNLQFLGHTVLEAKDGEEALQLATSELPDLIVLDIMMPGKDGLSTLRELAASPVTSDIPVVLLSAKAGINDQLQGWEAGADDYLTKPFTPYDLARAIEMVTEASPDERRERR